MRRTLPDQPIWDEFHDDEIVDWKRCRSAIEHENTLVNHRLSWLFASQAFLFAAFGVVFNAWKNPSVNCSHNNVYTYQILLATTSIIGMMVCLAIQQSLWGAELQIILLDRWWYDNDDQKGSGQGYVSDSERNAFKSIKDKKHPPLQGYIHIPGRPLMRFFSFTHTPLVFVFSWATILLLVVFELKFPFAASQFFSKHGLILLSHLGVGAAVGLAVLFVTRKARQ
jgi:hypothetical protein